MCGDSVAAPSAEMPSGEEGVARDNYLVLYTWYYVFCIYICLNFSEKKQNVAR